MISKAESWKIVSQVMEEIIDLEPDARFRYLESADLDDAARREIESLLSIEDAARDFLAVTAGGLSNGLIDTAARPVSGRIGDFEIVGEIGIGGMGAVFRGRRADGNFDQQVAIKTLRREFNTESIRANFEHEKRIQAKLSHPNIARILNAGMTDDGIPFLVMEYVDGLAVDEFCEVRDLDLTQRLKLFNKICDAVSYLHRNLIIHRDLKPSNILVDASGEPKILDFGISKLLDENATELRLATKIAAMTPEYASPEQIQGGIVTTATDIYSLGVVLYRILAGRSPFAGGDVDRKELLRAIVETDAPPPSTVPSASSFRQQLKGDLDNIALKALSKEPERRYHSAEAFSADIWRHIDNVPVEARPSTISYRFGRFLRRNRLAATAAAIVVLTLIAGISVSTWQMRKAQASAAIANDQRAVAVVESERARAEQARSEKVTKFMSRILGYGNPRWYAAGAKFGKDARVIDAIVDLSDAIDREFSDDPATAAELHHQFTEILGTNSGRLGATEQRRRRLFHAQRALELRRRAHGEVHEFVATDMVYLYWAGGVPDDERAAFLMKAINMMRQTNPGNPNFPFMLEDYAVAMSFPGTFAKWNESYRAAVDPPTDENSNQISERMLREAIPHLKSRYSSDQFLAGSLAECMLSYVLAAQNKWSEFDEHYALCGEYLAKYDQTKSRKSNSTAEAVLEIAKTHP